MKIEKLTENKIRIVVNIQELSSKNIDLNDFMISNLTSQKFFLEILNKAEKEVGFKTNNCKLLIEAFSSLDDFYVFTITKFKKPKNKHTYKFNKALNYNKTFTSNTFKNPIYKFTSFEEFCSFCEAIYKSNISVYGISKKVSLYFYNNTYYLVFFDLNFSYNCFKKLFSTLSEFGYLVRDFSKLEPKLIEYGKPIIKQNAIRTGIKYFV